MSKPTETQKLPSKEANLFKKLLKFYDQKHYKKALNIANLILSNPVCSQHGETLAFKGLMMFNLGKKSEAKDLIKRGLMLNVQSYVCWHVYGTMHKMEKNYEEAIRCFTQALRIGPENVQFYRELCALQMQTRNYEACKETRAKCISNKIVPKTSCLGYIVVQHMLKNYDSALLFLDEYIKILPEINPTPYEASELFLYKISILIEAKKYSEALKFLNLRTAQILDKSSFFEYKAELYIALGNLESAVQVSIKLLDRNSECKYYYLLYCRASGISVDNEFTTECLSVLKKALEMFPKSRFLKRTLLGIYSGEEFLINLDNYLQSSLVKGVPPLFLEIEYLYDDPEKKKVITSLIDQYSSNLSKFSTFGPIEGITKNEPSLKEPPTTTLWLNYFRAQHMKKLGNIKEALNIIHEELVKTPTVVDFYNFVGECLIDSGDLIGASRWVEEAQSLDTADRYINSSCVKSLIKANRIPEAESMAFKFTFGSKSSVEYLIEMQCMWFLTEMARAYQESNDLGLALKHCHLADRCYASNVNDQMDFHSYCIRKVTLRAYVESIHLCDNIRSHPSYFDAAFTAIKIYLHLYKNPYNENENQDNKVEMSAENKKRRAKERKAAFRAKEEAERQKALNDKKDAGNKNKHSHSDQLQTTSNDDDPTLLPINLVKPEDPIEEAKRFLIPLREHFSHNIETHCLSYEIYERKNMIALMFSSIGKGASLQNSENHPWLHECRVRFLIKFASFNVDSRIPEGADDETKTIYSAYNRILNEKVKAFFNNILDAKTFNESKSKEFPNDFKMQFSCQISRAFIDSKNAEKFYNDLPSIDNPKWSSKVSWRDALYVLTRMRDSIDHEIAPIDAETIDSFRAKCKSFFPMSTAFHTDEEKSKVRDAIIKEVSRTKNLGLYSRCNDKSCNTDQAAKHSFGRIDDWLANLSLHDGQTCQ